MAPLTYILNLKTDSESNLPELAQNQVVQLPVYIDITVKKSKSLIICSDERDCSCLLFSKLTTTWEA